MAPKIERVTEGCLLGEGPHWDSENQELYFVDIFGQDILRYSSTIKKVYKASLAPKAPSFIIPIANKKNHFIVALDNELADIEWDGQSKSVSKVELLDTITESTNKFNDGKCDSSGRLWAGSHTVASDLEKTEPLGTLYSFDTSRQLRSQVGQIRIANGLAFNDKAKKMYFIDSLTKAVTQYDFDINKGTISNKQILFTLSNFAIPGIPDGMTIDTDGNLWVAVFGGGRVLKIDAKKPETLLQTIDLPAVEVSSLIFGGENLDELFVTTGAIEIMGLKGSPPVGGATYKITNTGSKGVPGNNFKLH